jgi:ribonucleoside-diphosphate reductase alpha chain
LAATATAAVIRWRCQQLGALQEGGHTPVLDAMFSRDEPRTTAQGTLAGAVDVSNPATGEAFTVTLKEVQLPSGDGGLITRPCALGLSGNSPRALDGLARLLSLDMRVIDPVLHRHEAARDGHILQVPQGRRAAVGEAIAPMAGAPCPECGNRTPIHKDGCDFCTACGYVGCPAEQRRCGDRSKAAMSSSGTGG